MENEQQLIIAANNGDPEAQYKLGCYYNSDECYGDALNEEGSAKWYKMAAEQGHAGAQYMLGECYYTQMGGVSKNFSEAFKWYTLAAMQGHAEAQASLGIMYYSGIGVPKNKIEALKWIILAANQGNVITGKAAIQRRMTDAEVAESQKRASAFVKKTN